MSKFKIGKVVVCNPDFDKISDELKKQWTLVFNDVDNERLIIGESYLPEEFFTDDKSLVREQKINQILS